MHMCCKSTAANLFSSARIYIASSMLKLVGINSILQNEQLHNGTEDIWALLRDEALTVTDTWLTVA